MTSIGRQPTGAVTNAREVRLALASTKDGSFRCELTRGAVLVIDDECDPNRRFSTAEEGEYVLRVRARVALPSEGEFEGPWAVDAFRVDHTPPETELVAGIEELGLTNRTQEQFRLAGGDAYECALDGAAFTPCGPEVVLTGLGVGPHRLTARALDAAGNADPTPVTRTWRVTADLDGDGHVLPADCQDADPAIHPGAREIYDNAVDEDCDGRAAEDPDRDRDGQVRPVDCNDRDARIGPGQPEQPGNRVDEDCDGVVERFPSLGSRVNFSFELRSGGRTRITALYVSQAVRGSTIRVSCRTPRRACAVRGRVEVRRNTRRLDLLRRLERRTLRARAVIVVTVTKPGHRGTVTRLVMRGGRSPRRVERCTSPGSSRRLRC